MNSYQKGKSLVSFHFPVSPYVLRGTLIWCGQDLQLSNQTVKTLEGLSQICSYTEIGYSKLKTTALFALENTVSLD